MYKNIYTTLRNRYRQTKRLSYYYRDFLRVARYMYWHPSSSVQEADMEARLLFYYHRIEKGLSMPGPHRLFGLSVIPVVMSLIEKWEVLKFNLNSPIYLGSLKTLESYAARVSGERLDPSNKVLSVVTAFVNKRMRDIPTDFDTPIRIKSDDVEKRACHSQLRALYEIRKSFRNYSNRVVPMEILREAISMAQLSPSVCNRQSSKVYVVSEARLKESVLSYQNGNEGFGHLASNVLVVVSDMRFFVDASERNQPFVDGGLFSMSLVYALQAQGVVSCCLNWCVTSETDRKFHQRFNIPDYELVIMLITVGYPPEEAYVPRSHRRSIDDVCVENFQN